jgi:hypothetical protein
MEDRLPLAYQIACLILTALFVWSFSIAREPRGWRRLYQSLFSKPDTFSVNKNKFIDEKLKRWGIRIAMLLLVADVTIFVVGITAPTRMRQSQMTPAEWQRVQEMRRLEGNKSGMSTLP